MPQALECAKDLFKDDSDSPLAALEGYTNKQVKEFDCKGHDYEHYTKIVDFYNSDAKTKLATGRQSFFHGYQQVAKAFLKTA